MYTLHFTPTSGSWLNMVEVFFGIITRQAIRRGSFTSVQDLITAIETFIDRFRAPPLATAQSTGNDSDAMAAKIAATAAGSSVLVRTG